MVNSGNVIIMKTLSARKNCSIVSANIFKPIPYAGIWIEKIPIGKAKMILIDGLRANSKMEGSLNFNRLDIKTANCFN